MSDLDAMEHNGRNHNGKEHEVGFSEGEKELPGSSELWDEIGGL